VTIERNRPTVLDWSGVVVFCLCAALGGVLELLLVPLYAGSVIVPISVLGAVFFNIALPKLARSLVDSTLASVLPFLSWLAVVIVLGMLPRPEGDVILPGGGGAAEWVAYGVLLGGALAGTVTVVALTNPA
jgi:hypothetical protein